MNNSISSIRFTDSERQCLVDLKRRTGIQAWNVLCRWAVCLSLGTDERVALRPDGERRDALEIDWETLAGSIADHLLVLAEERRGEKDPDTDLRTLLTAHFSRGVSQLHKSIVDEKGLLALVS